MDGHSESVLACDYLPKQADVTRMLHERCVNKLVEIKP